MLRQQQKPIKAADNSEPEDAPMEDSYLDLFKKHLEAELAVQKLVDSAAKLRIDQGKVGNLKGTS